MSHWELSIGKTDDYYTPPEIFEALERPVFDMDVAAAIDPRKAFVSAKIYLCDKGIETPWNGFVWCNPPYGVRGSKMDWVEKMIRHRNGLLLLPDRTSADWWQVGASSCDMFLTTFDKIKFISPDGKINKQPSVGNTIFAFGGRAVTAIKKGQVNSLGLVFTYALKFQQYGYCFD
jgi:hypothetical protein